MLESVFAYAIDLELLEKTPATGFTSRLVCSASAISPRPKLCASAMLCRHSKQTAARTARYG